MIQRSTWILLAALAGQIFVAERLRQTRPALEILPLPPTSTEVSIAALGDHQFLYRRLALALQNFGDTGGRVTPLKNYDMERVVDWLELLDSLDLSAKHHVLLAARYFGETQNRADTIHLIRFIQRHVARNPPGGLQWMTEAITLARRLDDRSILLDLAEQLGSYDFPQMTIVAYQLPAIIFEREGRYREAVRYMERAIARTSGRASETEAAFMEDFVAQARLRAGVETPAPANP